MTRKPDASPNRPVTVIVRVRNEAAIIRTTLIHLKAQTVAPYEILLVDDHSTDDTVAVATKAAKELHLPFRIVPVPDPGGYAAGCNTGWQAASTPLVAYLSADCLPEPTWLEELLKGKAVTGARVVQGYEAYVPRNEVHDLLDYSGRRATVPSPVRWPANTNTLYERSLIQECGGFSDFCPYGYEDVDFGIKLRRSGKGQAWIIPAARTNHHMFDTWVDLAKTIRNNGRATWYMLRRFPLIPTSYLSYPYWTFRDIVQAVRTFDWRYLKLAWYRLWYWLVGFTSEAIGW